MFPAPLSAFMEERFMRVTRQNLATIALSTFACILLSGCLSTRSYIDPALPLTGKADVGSATTPGPVQVLSEFRTNGNANARATALMRPRVLAVLNESGLFSSASESQTASAGRLTMVIDNVPLTENAAGKGFGTGLTFGAVGTMVSDGYTATMTYTRGSESKEVTVKHAIHTTVGNHSGPAGLTPVSMDEAANKVIDQLTWNGLKQLSEKGAFE
jgi:hypothetical protein